MIFIQNPTKVHVINASAIGIYRSDFNKQYTESDKDFSDTFDGVVVRQWEEEAKQFENCPVTQPSCVLGWCFPTQEVHLFHCQLPLDGVWAHGLEMVNNGNHGFILMI
ncbi:MAG: hypothetical protein CM15mP32_4220 [Flavobacteriaceae bacterium]|nr:MAG: hypothetical protein CM15mP32_4220 [Flavobacteriaceae bacterium]